MRRSRSPHIDFAGSNSNEPIEENEMGQRKRRRTPKRDRNVDEESIETGISKNYFNL